MHFIFKFLIGFVVVALVIVIIGLVILKYVTPDKLKLPKGATRDEKVAMLDEWLNNLHSTNQFNGSVLIARDGDIILNKSYGYADLAKKQPLSQQSSFNLASLSKPFTALGVLMLVEEGKLTLDESVVTYLPSINYPQITIRHLLNHNSGLPDYMELASQHWEDKNVVFKSSDLLDLYSQHQPELLFKPGDKHKYSNTGYVVLAALIEEVSGMSFEDYMDKKVFIPVGMNDTSVFNLLSDENKLENRVWGTDGEELNDLMYLDGVAGDGGIYSTTHDLLKWTIALDSEKLISKELLEEAYSPGKLNSGKSTDYGFGWIVEDKNVYWHNGGWVGFSSLLRKDLNTDSTVIFLDSGSNSLSSLYIEGTLVKFIKKF
ncbi:serine hydrolase [Kangiella sp. HZ709]|uniref:serine hydrolase domain-containing protein n=1 Tax=Kangiella sp. HZ709 TaxID=2666328 RepID=UPI0012B05438|nr:serine hydrolase domain-containing protein [Kangiella sp. HZ709]MRX26723.1 serine hydrolase [Kangiella sp. HZ709]